jgi:hypothetical protein
MAAGILRFPGATAIAAMYFLPLIAQFSLSVAINANATGTRVGGAIIFTFAMGGVFAMGVVTKRHGGRAKYVPDEPIASLPWYKNLYRIRGKWRCDSEADRKAFGYLYDDFITNVRYYTIVDLVLTTCIGVAAAIEPDSFRGCVIKVGCICALFVASFLMVVVTRPYRRHVANIFFGLITFALATASAVTLGAISGRSNSTTKWAADVSVQIVGNLIVMKLLFDFGFWAYSVFLARYVNRIRKDEVAVTFKVVDDIELFPHARKMMGEWDEAAAEADDDDLQEGLLAIAEQRQRRAAPEEEAALERQAEERRRAKELMDAI